MMPNTSDEGAEQEQQTFLEGSSLEVAHFTFIVCTVSVKGL
jgi:hypothetical protein